MTSWIGGEAGMRNRVTSPTLNCTGNIDGRYDANLLCK